MISTIRYIRARLNERSTWLLIGTGIAGAAALTAPWSYVAAAIGVIAALVPDGGVK
jgi:hypothetical protein